MKVLLFGAGHYYQFYKNCFGNVEITGLLDNNKNKQGCRIDGHIVYAPEQITSLSYEQIWLLSFDTADMRKQLLSLGVSEDSIYEVWELGYALGKLLVVPNGTYYSLSSETRIAVPGDASGKVVLLTPNLMLNGAEIALMQMVHALLCLGYNPLVASLRDGPLRRELLALNVPVIIMGEAAHEIPLAQLVYLSGAKVYILNTIEMYLLMQKREKKIPVAWWLHDSDMVYQETHIIDEPLSKLELSSVNIRAVSPIAADAFRRHYGQDIAIIEMPFGLYDWARGRAHRRNLHKTHPFTFSVVGSISRIKAQRDFIHAVQMLPEIMCKTCRFCIIGSEGSQELAKNLREQAAGMPNIQFMGELGREELLRFYAEEMDILVCPSRSDTLPIVTVEAMMFSCPVIASGAVGTTQMLLNANAGLSVPVGDSRALADAMQWMYEHPYERKRMGISARKLYEKNFTMESFQARVNFLMQELVGTA